MQETGLIDRLKDKWWGFKLAADSDSDRRGKERFQALTLGYENVLFPFGVAVAGMLVALMAVIAEQCGGVVRKMGAKICCR